MRTRRAWIIVFFIVSIAAVGIAGAAKLTPMERLGKELLFANISDPPWMSCATCHAPEVGFTGPVAGINQHGAVYRGAVPVRFGNRKPPAASYATTSPVFHFDEEEGLFVGGNFWDGRATGEDLGNPAADQARGPFLNPVEQNMPSKIAVCERVRELDLEGLFKKVWVDPLDCSEAGIDTTYDRIALSIAEYEDSTEVNQFSSKYDAFLAGRADLTEMETWGLELFEGKAMCSACHISEPGEDGAPPLFTDYTFDNLGVPKNPENPFYTMDTVFLDDGSPINPEGFDWVDPGLGGFLETRLEWEDMAGENMGKHKVPTLRNVAKGFGGGFPTAYSHNGYFKSLKTITHFYNTRDVKPECLDPFTTEKDAMELGCWPAPEVADNVNTDELGDLGLTPEEEDAIVAFMGTLSDGYFNPNP
jgi:cytochrome c peroxidase